MVRALALGATLSFGLVACGSREPLNLQPSTIGATLAASTTVTCARFDARACCWGNDGMGHTIATPMAVALPEAPSDLAVLGSFANAGKIACAVVAGEVFCWSFTAMGMTAPEKLGVGPGVLRITANDEHACALREDRTVVCWGAASFGQLGDGRIEQGPLPPSPVAMLSDVVEIAAGEWHTCALRSTGDVMCWGFGFGTPMACGGATCSATPVAVSLPAPVIHVSAGGLETCAQGKDGTVYCFRDPASVAAVPSLASAPTIRPGYALGCGIASDHHAICWGRLGHASTVLEVDHAPIAGLERITEYASGWYHACARTDAGEIVCFGANDQHQLGDGTTVDSAAPRAVTCP